MRRWFWRLALLIVVWLVLPVLMLPAQWQPFGVGGASADPVALSLAMKKAPSSFGRLTCQQLRRLETKVLRSGGVCPPGSGRSLRVSALLVRCLSTEERVLPRSAQIYLGQVRAVMARKACSTPRR